MKRSAQLFGVSVLLFAALLGTMWITPLVMKPYVGFAFRYVFDPLGSNRWPELFSNSFAFLVICGPFIIPPILFSAWKTFHPSRSLPDRMRQQLADLDRAQSSISDSLSALRDLKAEIAANISKHDELRALVDRLNSTASETSDSLRQKLDAIEAINRNRDRLRTMLAFVSGVFASLVASAIWQMLLPH